MSYLSTGQASELLSVTRDTILKWIKQGRISAVKTAGGHHRISEQEINSFLGREEPTATSLHRLPQEKDLMHCWQFFATDGRAKPGCTGCLVYRAQALKCFEMKHLPRDLGYNGGSCSSSCDTCSYYRYHLGRPYNVLVITDDEELKGALVGEGGVEDGIRLQLAGSAYECSLLIERFRPDFVVVDCAMDDDKCREICHHLAGDSRIPRNTVILADPPRRISITFPGTLRMRHPFTLNELINYLRENQNCRAT
jgi:excisionase family DNA binding protein